MAIKFIKSYGKFPTFGWGNWNDLKKDYLFLASENTRNYHGDVFIAYEQMQKFLNKVIEENILPKFWFIISCHDCGADFLTSDNFEKDDPDFFKQLILRISGHEGSFIIGSCFKEVFTWEKYSNEKALEWSRLISEQNNHAFTLLD